MAIRLLVTGGTFDKEYDEIRGALFFRDTHLPEMLRLGRCRLDVRVRTLMLVDSLEMSDSDRRTIAANCSDVAESRIVITHGTDTMVETAAVLKGIAERTVVLTGALNPARFRDSDAVFNIGCAVGALQGLKPGVYIAMNGRLFHPDKVRKNRTANCFEEI